MKTLTIPEIAAFLLHGDNYVILTHRRPDGDTIGCAAALCRGLRAMGKQAAILENPQFTPKFRPYLDGLTVPEPKDGDCILAVDIASSQLLPYNAVDYVNRVELLIDHHGRNDSYAKQGYVNPEAAACGELIFELLQAMQAPLDKAIAEAIYLAVSTDTGCFRFANTTAHTFRVAAACAEGGARVYQLNQELFETNTLGKLRMQGWIVEHMRLLHCGTMAICAIPRSVELELGVTSDDMDNISNFPRTVAGVNVAATIRETEDGLAKISVRAVPGYDATVIAEKFGGGGHKGAAGASLRLPMAQVEQIVEQAMLETCQ